MKQMRRLYTSRSNTLENTGKTDTGLQFENTMSSPDLNIGTTFAIFISKGKNTAERFITYMGQWSFDTLFYILHHEWF